MVGFAAIASLYHSLEVVCARSCPIFAIAGSGLFRGCDKNYPHNRTYSQAFVTETTGTTCTSLWGEEEVFVL